MNNYVDNGAWFPSARQAGILGKREDIGLVGLYPDKNGNGQLMAVLRTGFLTAEGLKQTRRVRTRTTDHVTAQCKMAALIQQLQYQWDQFATALTAGTSKSWAPATPLVEPTTEMIIDGLLSRWSSAGHRSSVLCAYKSAAKRFLKHSGDLAKQTPGSYTPAACQTIRDQLVEGFDPKSDSCAQFMHILRFVLREAGFTEDLAQIFCAPRKVRTHRSF
jgi:hypothetical protein